MIVKRRYIEIEIPDESEKSEKSENNEKDLHYLQDLQDLQPLEKDLQIPLEIINGTPSEILNGTPSEILNDTPSEILNDTPSEILNDTPSEILNDTPSEILNDTPSEILNDTPSEILNDIASRLGKMRIQDIAYDLNTNISIVKKYRKEILDKLSDIQKAIIICQEQKIEKLRKKILAGEMERRPHYSFDVEGLIRGIVRDLTRQRKSIRDIVEQTHLETSTISYHRKKNKNGERRKYPP